MRIETIPLILGILIALSGVAVWADGRGDPDIGPMRERRRRIRASIDPIGEQLVGVGTTLLGIALIGRDTWRFGTLVVILGALLVVWGAVRNRHYIQEILLFRGVARRGFKRPTDKPPKMRIR